MNISKVDTIIKKYGSEQAALMSILQDIQLEYNYLPRETLEHVSKKMVIPLSKIYGIATFYKAFSLTPRGRHLIKVCLGTACHVRGAPQILEEMERKIGICAGETTKDLKFTLERVNCLGACALGPLVVIDNDYYGQMTSAKVDKILKAYD